MQLKMKQLELEFSREKEPLFEKWLTSDEITTHFDKIREEIFIEEFKQCIH
jgi:hypothetical protein